MGVMAFFSVGPLEIAVLAVIALLVLGPQKLPEAARSVGKGMREMRNALSGASYDDEDEETTRTKKTTSKRTRPRSSRTSRHRHPSYQKLAVSIVSSSSSRGLV